MIVILFKTTYCYIYFNNLIRLKEKQYTNHLNYRKMKLLILQTFSGGN